MVNLSTEQQRMVDLALSGHDVIVDSTVGAGKTTAIQALCSVAGRDRRVLYLTYSKLLKLDAQRRVTGAKVQNYHGIVYPSLMRAGIRCAIGQSIGVFNKEFDSLLKHDFPVYDMLVIDEYQDITEEYAQLIRNIKSLNPDMVMVLVGDTEQKVKANTRIDTREFATEICVNPTIVNFSQSFRIGPVVADQLAHAWNKTVIGANTDQVVYYMSYETAFERLKRADPGQVLCLGTRNGVMSVALNSLEQQQPAKYNKNTVYASIQGGDSTVNYDDNTAVFTTFDASKGLERDICVVFDYTPKNWKTRNGFPNVDHIVMRNIFLVAASRGKSEIIFVGEPEDQAFQRSLEGSNVGYIPTTAFAKITPAERPVYEKPISIQGAFDFTFVENVQECFNLIQMDRIDDGAGEIIEIDRNDGLIDLSPAVEYMQLLMYFDNASAEAMMQSIMGADSSGEAVTTGWAARVNDDRPRAWRDALMLSAASTRQRRYADQVDRSIDRTVLDALQQRMSTYLPSGSPVHGELLAKGTAFTDEGQQTPVNFVGRVSAMDSVTEELFQIYYRSELSKEVLCEMAMMLCVSRKKSGIVANTRTGELIRVTVPSRGEFMDAAITCITRQNYTLFE